MSKRPAIFNPGIVSLLSLLLFIAPASSEVKEGKSSNVKVAVKKSLTWLAGKQNDDGSWSESLRFPHNTGITAFAFLAFMADGNFPGKGKFAETTHKAELFLLDSQNKHGYLAGKHGGNMYCHAYAVLALVKSYQATKNPKTNRDSQCGATDN